MDVKVLITAEALIMAGLLAWAQMWAQTSRWYQDKGQEVWYVLLVLAAIYTAVLGCLSSIGIAMYVLLQNGTARHFELAVELAGFSASIMFILVLWAALGALWKASTRKAPIEPTVKKLTGFSWLLTAAAVALGILLLITWLLRIWGWLEIPPPEF